MVRMGVVATMRVRDWVDAFGVGGGIVGAVAVAVVSSSIAGLCEETVIVQYLLM